MRGLAFLLGSWLVAGACSSSPPAPPADSGEPAAGATSAVAPRWPAWGEPPRSLSDATLHRELLAAELDRDPNAPALASALSSSDPTIATRAAWSLARIGGPAAAEHFVGWLSDGQPRPPGTLAAIAALDPPRAAEGLGDPEGIWAELEERLWQRYAVTEVPATAAELLLAIARVGGSISQTRLAVDLAVAPSDDGGGRYARGMDAVAILCRRGFPLPAQGVDAIARGLESGPLPRQAAAVALERCAGPSAEQLAGPVRAPLARLLATRVSEDADDQDAQAAWAALGALGELPPQVPADVLGARPRHFTVEVAAVRALAANADGRPELVRRLAAIDLSNVTGSRWHAVLEAMRSIRPALEGTPELLDALAPMQPAVEVALKGAVARDRKALVLVRCELLALAAIRSGELDTLEHCADGEQGISATHGVRLAIESLLRVGAALSREQKVGALLGHATDPRADVAAAALSALAEIDDPRVEATLREALKGDDVGIVSAAAASIAARAVDRQRRDPDAAAALGAAIARLGNDRAVEARIAAIEALGNLARSAEPAVVETGAAIATSPSPAVPPLWLERDVLPLASDPNQGVRAAARRALSEDAGLLERFDAAVPQAFPQAFAPAVHAALDAHREVRALKVHTDAGSFSIDLRGAPAPIAQANLVALAAAGFFEGLTFHRVVPGFVIQGGDPRGDGYGGPGHVMPCEWSNLRYERGTVGIALAGKDTGGSQIFVSHGRPVHLDARYTVIGRVTDGLEVVDAVLPYDAISRVEMLEDPAP